MSSMFTPSRPSASAISATTPGLVLDGHAKLGEDAAGRAGSPAGGHVRPGPATATPRPRPRPRRGSVRRPPGAARRRGRSRRRRASAFEVKMSFQIAGFAPATRVVSRKLRPTSGRRSPSSEIATSAWETITFAITWGRWLTVAIRRSWSSASIACGRAPDLRDRALEAVVVDAPGLLARREVPARALEELRPGVLDPGRLGAGDRMPADEAPGGRVRGEALDEIPLGRADVGDDRVVAARLERLARRDRADGRRAPRRRRCRRPRRPRRPSRRPTVRAPSSSAGSQPRRASGRTRRPQRRGAAGRQARPSRRSGPRRRRRPSWARPYLGVRGARARLRPARRGRRKSSPSPCRRR